MNANKLEISAKQTPILIEKKMEKNSIVVDCLKFHSFV